MRELISVDSSVTLSDTSTNINNMESTTFSNNVNLPLLSTTNPGLFTLTHEQQQRWFSLHSINEFYKVEDEPFARGKFATVRRVVERISERPLAAKYLKKRRRSTDLRPEIIHEVAVLAAMTEAAEYIVRLEKVFETNHEIILILELAPGGELQTVLDSEEGLEENHVIRFMRQILLGLANLHALNIAHLDLKPQNLVLTADFPACDVKLCDFGISRYIAEGADVRELLGTPDYVAPEVLNYEPISIATDMWSVGVLAYVLLTGYSPFGGDSKQETFCNITKCKLDFPPELFEDVSENAKDFISNLLVKKASQRLTVRECLHHPWLEDSTCLPHSQLTTPVPSVIQCELTPVPSLINQKSNIIVDNIDNTPPPTVISDINSNIVTVQTNVEKTPEEIPLSTPSTTWPRPQMKRRFSKTERCYHTNALLRHILNSGAIVVTSSPNKEHYDRHSEASSMSIDTSSDMSVDSSSDRSSIVSIDDSADVTNCFLTSSRRYISDTSSLASSSEWSVGSSVTSATLRRRGSLDFLDRPSTYANFSPSLQTANLLRLDRECSGSFARAYEKFSALSVKDDTNRSSAKETLRLYTGRSRVISNFKLAGGDMVVIREFAQRKGSLTKQAEVRCESVRSRMKKFEMVI